MTRWVWLGPDSAGLFRALTAAVHRAFPERPPFGGMFAEVIPHLTIGDLIERAGTLSPAKLSEIDDALRAGEHRTEWTPAAAAKLSEIKDSLRPGGLH